LKRYSYYLELSVRKWQGAAEHCIMKSFITLYASINFIRVMKSGRMRWDGHAAHMGEMRNAEFGLENIKGRDHSEEHGVDGKI
jgi:hypothetical protein